MGVFRDIIVDEDGLPRTNGNDLLVDYADEQQMRYVLLARPGHFRHLPTVGVGITDYLNAPETPSTRAEITRSIRLNFRVVGYRSVRIQFPISTLKIEFE